MLTKKELEIVNYYRKGLFRRETIRGIMRSISKSSYTWTFNAVKKMIKKGILSAEIKGKSTICSVNLDSFEAINYLALLDHYESFNSNHLPQRNIAELIDNFSVDYFTFIITGSYAEKKQKKESDLDVCVITDDANKKKVHNHLFNKGSIMIPKVHAFVFSREEFIQMLLDREENYAKLLYKKRLIYFGAENYYLIIKEAVKNGFR